MGTVLHLCGRCRMARSISSFSPLLDGDGVASRIGKNSPAWFIMFQSPSRWGRCCILYWGSTGLAPGAGFSPLLDGDGVASMRDDGYLIQLGCFSPLLE